MHTEHTLCIWNIQFVADILCAFSFVACSLFWDFGFRVWGLGFRVLGLGFRV